jgi:hypothetical protein
MKAIPYIPMKQSTSGPHLRKTDVQNPLRRRGPIAAIQRFIYPLKSWFLDFDLNTIEKVTITYQFCAVIAIGAYSSRVIATPPPVWQTYVLCLPSQVWAAFIFFATIWQLIGREKNNYCVSRNSAILSLFIAGGMLGPLWLKASGWCCVAFFAFIYQSLLAAKFYLLCKEHPCDD